jgi:hypothetical protein
MARYLFDTNHLSAAIDDEVGIRERIFQLRRAGHRPGSTELPQQNNRPGPSDSLQGGLGCRIPAMTDFRAEGTIMGPAGLTAVFGMGTGVTPPVWSPEKRPSGGQAGTGTGFRSVDQPHTSQWHSHMSLT